MPLGMHRHPVPPVGIAPVLGTPTSSLMLSGFPISLANRELLQKLRMEENEIEDLFLWLSLL